MVTFSPFAKLHLDLQLLNKTDDDGELFINPPVLFIVHRHSFSVAWMTTGSFPSLWMPQFEHGTCLLANIHYFGKEDYEGKEGSIMLF